ncbi:MAG: hypothetical protein V1732_05245 [Patescibacteria group bacterium]
MKIVLDFDDTIFNTHQMAQEFIKVFERNGFSEEEFYNAWKICLKKIGKFDLDTVIDLIVNSNKSESLIKKKIKEKINLILFNTDKFIYSDFFDFISGFEKNDLILLSFGEINFQRTKIENSKIASFFVEVMITVKNKVENLKLISKKHKNDKIFFIDDKAEQIDMVKKNLPQIITFKMERSQGEHVDVKSNLTDYIVKNLDEARVIINELNK